ncbi:hypothetical protein [Streptosporangium sp. NPDC004631]
MIVEDEHGREYDLNDLADDREPEPPDDELAPLDLSAIADAYHKALGEDLSGVPEHCREVLAAVSGLLAQAHDLQEALAYWRGLPVREEYGVTADGGDPDQAPATPARDADHALRLARRPGRQAWVRSLTVHGWLQLSTEPPF